MGGREVCEVVLMQNEILNQRIIRALNTGPQSVANLAMSVNAGTDEVREAVRHLVSAGRVAVALDGRRYELASGGYYNGPTGGDAA